MFKIRPGDIFSLQIKKAKRPFELGCQTLPVRLHEVKNPASEKKALPALCVHKGTKPVIILDKLFLFLNKY